MTDFNLNALKIGVIGGGSWATAIVKILLNNINQLNWFIRNQESVDFIYKHHHNPHYLSSVELDIEKLSVSCDINQVVDQSDLLIFAVPSAFLKNALSNVKISLQNKMVISAIKGIVPVDNLIVGEFFHQQYHVFLSNIGVIAGPCHAEEVALERLSYLTVASQDIEKAKVISQLLECRYIKTVLSDDIYGTEYSAVIKNIIAIASGICHSLGYGDNFQAVLVANAIQEIKRFVDTVHPINRDIKGSGYLGDLLVTAYSQFSRNRTFGAMIGKGYSVKSAQLEMNMIAEGYYATDCIHSLLKQHTIKMPICEAVYNILYNNAAPSVEISLLTQKLR
jgi:glycerol-3-phosphate dehydrogenase (NAD(P)+)